MNRFLCALTRFSVRTGGVLFLVGTGLGWLNVATAESRSPVCGVVLLALAAAVGLSLLYALLASARRTRRKK